MELFLVIASWLVFGGATSYFAAQRGRDPFAWFLIGMLLGVLGLVLLFLLPVVAVEAPLEEVVPPPPCMTLEANRLKEWFYLDEQKQTQGPLSFAQLKQAWLQGKMHQQSFVWSEGMEGWKRVSEITELQEDLGAHLT